jgi:hypothetical protein
MIATVVRFVFVEALRDTGDDVLETRKGIYLGEDSGHPVVAPVCVQQSLGVTIVMPQDAALLAEQIFQLVKGGLVKVRPIPRSVQPGEGVKVMGEDAVIGEEAAVVIAEA